MSKDKSEEKKMEENEEEKEKNMDQNESEVSDKRACSKEERDEYFGKLEKWLHEAYAWQTFIAMFPYYMMSNPLAGFEYKIPPLWKRCLAEFIDSIMLFCLKFGITFIAVDVFDFINVETYDFRMLQKNFIIDYKMTIELTSSLVILELIHRIIVCIFEACWLQRGLSGRIGGATPGKLLMGLRVVLCRNVTPIERPADSGKYVLVSPGADLGLPLALGRSLVKNLIFAFIFPMSFAMFFRFNRTGYDLLCNSIVVEDPYRNRNTNNNNQNNRPRPQF